MTDKELNNGEPVAYACQIVVRTATVKDCFNHAKHVTTIEDKR